MIRCKTSTRLKIFLVLTREPSTSVLHFFAILLVSGPDQGDIVGRKYIKKCDSRGRYGTS
jgi:hypothetical protein